LLVAVYKYRILSLSLSPTLGMKEIICNRLIQVTDSHLNEDVKIKRIKKDKLKNLSSL